MTGKTWRRGPVLMDQSSWDVTLVGIWPPRPGPREAVSRQSSRDKHPKLSLGPISRGEGRAISVRPDGREPEQLRPIEVEFGFQDWAEGSVLFSMGRTKVLVAASVAEEAPRWLRGTGTGWVTAEYSMLPRATAERTPREVSRGRPSGRTQEIQRLIG
ncbi:MAG: hypothetical protein AB1758_35955, partial [Candidatus Eremiobacterota bacterium]